jgi:hypothetical protein
VFDDAAEQVQRLGGIGDLLEDKLEHLHQMLKTFSDRTNRTKNKVEQAESHLKIEVKNNNKEIRALITKMKQESKWEFKKRRVDSSAKGVQAKLERGNSRIEMPAAVEEKPYTRIIFYENEKARQVGN